MNVKPIAALLLNALLAAAVVITIGRTLPPTETPLLQRASAADYASILLPDVPHVRQRPDFCGEACVEMWLRKLGYKIDQDDVFNVSGLDPERGRGCYTAEMVRALTNLGFKPGDVWYRYDTAKAAEQLETQWQLLHADLLKGIPSIVCMHYDDTPRTTEHFRLVLGYDAVKDDVIMHDPALENGSYRRMQRAKFFKLWPLGAGENRQVAIRLRLEGAKISPPPRASGFTDADYCQHIMTLREKRLPEGFSLVLQKPFVVVGDDPEKEVKRRAGDTVKWAVDQLKATYFEKEPEHILDVWLFKDEDSYKANTKKVFDDEPTTPYGYYSSAHRALIMNISTGGGTLVHEIVHPFMATNFPKCPSWFNEGLASLYEQSGSENGKIHGYTNWRLNGLQTAIKAKRVPSFETLCGTSTNEFYNQDRGTNYSQSRYLCYYLQEHDLLVKYYQQFRKNSEDDPTGYKTLQEVLGEKDMAEFKTKWEAWVLKLKR